MLNVGSRLGPYEIVARLGSGGMGEVYRARDDRLGRDVALKVLPEELSSNSAALARFQREARAASALNHPHIVAIHDVGSDVVDGLHISYFTMELIDGTTLRDRVCRETLRKLLGYLVQVAEALAKAHAAGVLHRDLKPENVMISTDGYAKVVDFGLAKFAPPPFEDDSPTAVAITAAGTIVGTVQYMSPEQVEGRELDHRSDVFSYGCMLYEVVAGAMPFAQRTSVDTMHAIVHDDPPPLAASGRAVPIELQRIVDRCLAKDPDERYQSIKEAAIEIRAVLRQLESNSAASAVAVPRHARGWAWPAVAGGVILIALAVAITVARDRGVGVVPTGAIQSLAILPFANGSHNPDTDYISDGITDDVINTLARIPRLRVLARSTVFQFKGKELEARAIGKRLAVDGIVVGELTDRNDLLNVKVELVRTSDGAQIWGEQYNRRHADLLAIQQEIARDISEQLRLHLSADDAKRIASRQTANLKAYQAYLRGVYFWNQRPAGMQKALESFNEAVREDPSYALAYAGIAQAYDTLGAWETGLFQPAFAFGKAREAAVHALRLDPDLAEAYAALGFVEMYQSRDFRAAEAHFRRAIALKPSYATAHHWASHLALAAGRIDESLRESQKALEYEPLDPVILGHLSWHYVYSRQPDRAIEQCAKTLEIYPQNFWAHYFLGLAYEQKGRAADAIAPLTRARSIAPTAMFAAAALGHVLAGVGRRDEAAAILRALEAPSDRYISPCDRAIVQIGLGETDAALRSLQAGVAESSSWVIYYNSDYRLDPLRHDPRFQAILRETAPRM